MIFHVYSFPLFSVSKNFTDFKDGFCYTAMLKRIRCGKPRREDGKRLHEVDICVDGSVVLKCWKWRFFKGWTTCVVFFVRKVSHCLLFFCSKGAECRKYHKDGRMVIFCALLGTNMISHPSRHFWRWWFSNFPSLVGYVIVPWRVSQEFFWRYPTRINPESPMDLRPQLHRKRCFTPTNKLNQKRWINGIGWNPQSLVDRRLVVLRFMDFVDWYLIMTTCNKNCKSCTKKHEDLYNSFTLIVEMCHDEKSQTYWMNWSCYSPVRFTSCHRVLLFLFSPTPSSNGVCGISSRWDVPQEIEFQFAKMVFWCFLKMPATKKEFWVWLA